MYFLGVSLNHAFPPVALVEQSISIVCVLIPLNLSVTHVKTNIKHTHTGHLKTVGMGIPNSKPNKFFLEDYAI